MTTKHHTVPALYLTSPTGVKVQLCEGYSFLDDTTAPTLTFNFAFQDDARTPLAADYLPQSSVTYRPTQPLAAFNGMTGAQFNGKWTLTVDDPNGADSGHIGYVTFGAATEQHRFACQMLVATVSSMVTAAVAEGDFERLVGLRQPLMAMVRSSSGSRA